MQVCIRNRQRNTLRTMMQPAHTEQTIQATFGYTRWGTLLQWNSTGTRPGPGVWLVFCVGPGRLNLCRGTGQNRVVHETDMPKFRSVQDILDFAIAQEIEAHDFYLSLAEMVIDSALRETIKGFAVDELQHRIRLEAIKAGQVGFIEEEVGSLEVAETVPEVEPSDEMSYADLLVIAMKKEKAAFRIYTNLASIATNQRFRKTLLGLAKEEAQHKLRLEIEYDWETS
jgi:rubrerythrin